AALAIDAILLALVLTLHRLALGIAGPIRPGPPHEGQPKGNQHRQPGPFGDRPDLKVLQRHAQQAQAQEPHCSTLRFRVRRRVAALPKMARPARANCSAAPTAESPMKKSLLFLSLSAGLAAPALADLQLAQSKNCMACHAVDKKVIGPSFKDVAAKYKDDK